MNEKHFNLLKELVESPSPSGFEQPAQRVFRRAVENIADEIRTDVMGNVIARLKGPGKNPLRVMLAGHCDEIGFMVKHIDDQGFISFAAIGGVDAHLVPGQRIRIHGRCGTVNGLVGKKPIHQIEPKDRDSVIKIKNQFIDIGCRSRDEAQELVAVGDAITFAVGLERLQNDRVTSRAFDDKMGVFIVARVLEELRSRQELAVDFYGVSTVQEEVGLRGGATSVYGINPDVGIAIEVGFATDFPDVDKKEHGDIRIGSGPVIGRGPNINPALFDLLVETAREEQIPYQVLGHPRATGTDANAMQLSRGGVATGLVNVPLRYMHTPVELLSLNDLENTVKLLAASVLRMKSREGFIPT